MRHAIILAAVLVWVTSLPGSALAEGSGGGLFDEIGRALFGAPRTSREQEKARSATAKSAPRPSTTPSTAERSPAASTRVLSAPASQDEATEESSSWSTASDMDGALPAPPPLTDSSEPMVEVPAQTVAAPAERTVTSTAPLHKRLGALRESVFPTASPTGSSVAPTANPSPTAPQPARTNDTPAMRSPSVSYGERYTAPSDDVRRPDSVARSSSHPKSNQTPTLAPPPRWAKPNPPIGGAAEPSSTVDMERAPLAPSTTPAGQSPLIGESSLDSADAGQAANVPTPAAPRATAEADRITEPAAQEAASSGGSGATADMLRRTIQRNTASPAGQAGDNVLFARQSPVLKVETLGPRRIAVGKESSYEVSIQNSGQVAAEQVVVMVDLPDWADVLGAQASAGATNTVPATEQSPRQFRWKVGRLEAKGHEKLILRIVPRQSRPFDLAVKWDYTPVSSQTMIEVQEAKLAMQLHGPREVLYGKPEVFRLEITNVGNGDADNVALTLAPVGSETPPATQQFGTLAAGEKKSIEVELTARHTGTLTINVDAKADGAEAHLAENILIRRANLQVSVEAPPMQFVGTPLTYRIHLSNPGSAAAQNVQITATLPADTKYVSSIQGGQLTSDRRKVVWTANNLAPGSETVLQLTAAPQKPGANRLDVLATADGELMASGDATTQVEAVADLSLSVSDPAGPVPVGEEAVYEIQLQNRGTKSAENVEIVAYFSNGIEPISAEGGRHRLGAGQVLFDPIPSVAAGQSLVLKIHARADQPGNLVFRAEVYCKPLGTRLVSEETTLFYNGTAAQTPANPASTPQYSSGAESSERTASSSTPPVPAPSKPRTAARTSQMR